MKPVPITTACLLLGGGLIILGLQQRRAQESAHAVAPATTTRPHPRILVNGGQPLPAAVSAALRLQPVLVSQDTNAQACRGQAGTTDLPSWSRRDGKTPRRPPPLPRMRQARAAADSPAVAGATAPVAAAGQLDPDARPAQSPGLMQPAKPPNSALRPEASRGGENPPICVPLSPTDPQTAATIPAVLAHAVTDSGLNQPELAGVAELAEEFVARVVGGSQNPQDPAHQERWAEAQADSDAQMRARYGSQAWLKHHQEAYRQALANVVD